MTTKGEIFESALQLPPDDRAELAEKLLSSLEDEPEVSEEEAAAAWEPEILRRVEDLRAGRVKTVDAFDALRRIQEDLERRRGKR